VTVRPIVRYPDRRLRDVAERVRAFDGELRTLAADLYDTMRAAPGIGITAPHIGVGKRVVVLRPAADRPARVYVNPAIVWASDERIRHVEGSVSMPGVTEEVERAARVRIAYQTIEGIEESEEATGLIAVCHQHEIDQLDGIFWLQRLSPLRRDRLIKRFQKLQKHS
jgi:peptide deformylase